MSYEIIRKPFMLLETVSMLFKFVNGATFTGLAKHSKWAEDDRRIRLMLRLQEIMNQVCGGLDPEQPELRRLFGRVEHSSEDVCLAQLMTYSFCTLEQPDFREHVDKICRIWRRLQEEGYWIDPSSAGCLVFSNGTEHPGSLLRQVRALNYPAEFRLELCDTLENFEASMHHMADLIEPLSDRLEAIYQEETWLLDELRTYWETTFQTISPLEVLASFGLGELPSRTEETMWVALSLMNTNGMAYGVVGESGPCAEHDFLILGSAITHGSLARRRGGGLDGVSAMLKCLSDRKRLEILQRLSKERSYGQELAEAMGMDPGNMSRNLGLLNSYGFLRQERETLRTYYRADQEAVHRFLVRLEKEIFK